MTNPKNKLPGKLSPMKAMRLADASEKLAGINFNRTRQMTPAEQAAWSAARRGPGRPRKPAAEKAARVLVTLAPELLAAADGYAQREGISRAELIARGILGVLAKDRGKRKTG
jgi:hypothetical protein